MDTHDRDVMSCTSQSRPIRELKTVDCNISNTFVSSKEDVSKQNKLPNSVDDMIDTIDFLGNGCYTNSLFLEDDILSSFNVEGDVHKGNNQLEYSSCTAVTEQMKQGMLLENNRVITGSLASFESDTFRVEHEETELSCLILGDRQQEQFGPNEEDRGMDKYKFQQCDSNQREKGRLKQERDALICTKPPGWKVRIDLEVAPLRQKSRTSSYLRRRERHDRRRLFQKHHAQLVLENARLRSQLDANKEYDRRQRKNKLKICDELEHLVTCGASDEQLEAKIHAFRDLYSEFGRHWCTTFIHHIDGLELLLEPIQVTKMTIWALHNEEVHQSIKERELNISHILIEELNVNCDQEMQFVKQSASASVMCGELRRTMNVLENLKREITDRNNIMRYEINRLESSLSPLQRAKLNVADFMGNEESCVHALYWKAVAFALMMCDSVSQLYESRQKWKSVMSMVS